MIEVKKKKLLVVAPHPDDEVIGCGGLIKKVKDNGGKVFVLFLTNGDTKDFSKKGVSTGKQRNKEIENVARFLKYDNFDIAFPGNEHHLKLDILGQHQIMEAIERNSKVSVLKVKPDIVAFPSPNSYNQDHRVAAESAHAVLRPAPKSIKHNVDIALQYEEAVDVWSLTQQTPPNFFITLTKEQIESKFKALKLYKSQDRPFPNMRSIKTLRELANMRGSESGDKFAEAFELKKFVI